MNRFFVTYGIAVKLKELGFDEPTMASFQETAFHKMGDVLLYRMPRKNGLTTEPALYSKYTINNSNILKAPSYAQVFEWFRDRGYNWYVCFINGKWYFSDGEKYRGSGKSFEDAQYECVSSMVVDYEKNKK